MVPLIGATLSMIAPQFLNRYTVCMGREENVFLERNILNSLDLSPANIIQ